jgi:hypothetical protein
MKNLILSICIPTYKPTLQLVRNIEVICSDLDELDTNYEIIISVNSGDEDGLFNSITNGCVKIFYNKYNLGFSRNLFVSMLNANGTYLLLLGDDDIPTTGTLQKVLYYLINKKDDTLLFIPLSDYQENTPSSYRKKLTWVYMRSGSMMGIVFVRRKINWDDFLLDHSIYPQVYLSLKYFISNGLSDINNIGFISPGSGGSLLDRFSDNMNRPLDYGGAERLVYPKKLFKDGLISYKNYLFLSVSIVHWLQSLYYVLKNEDYKVSIKFKNAYSKCISFDVKIFLFLLILIKPFKNNFKIFR